MNKEIKKNLALFVAVILTLCSAVGCKKTQKNSNLSSIASEIEAEDIDVGYEESGAVNIKLNGTSADITGSGAAENDGIITITAAGTYVLSGEMTNGRVVVDTDKNSKVKIVLNNASINCSDNAPVFIKKADKVFITLEDGTENNLTDGESYNLGEDDSNVDGAIFSRSDLTFNGSGKLTIKANYKHGIICKDDLIITGGEYAITSAFGGIYGKDSIQISEGTFDINAGSNAVKSGNNEESDKGAIKITGGNFNLTAGNDGIKSAQILEIEDGEFNITTGGGSENASVNSNGKPNENWGRWGGNMPDMQPQNGDMVKPDGKPNDDMMFQPTANNTGKAASDTKSDSAKALKAEQQINIKGGTFNIDSSDDSVHCNGDIVFSGGSLTLLSGDDGVHADGNLLITDGIINVEKSYEGLEGVTVEIQGGDIRVNASDDGINAAGGSDTGSSDRMGMDKFNRDTSDYLLTISDGKTVINASGDGVDSNGNFIMSGGELYINGPTDNGNGAIDYGDGASAWITGGTIVACGSTGMAEGFGEENSTQYSVLHNLSTNVPCGTVVKISDSKGNTVISYTPEKDFQSVVFSCDKLQKGTYTITAGDISEEITISSIVTSNGSFGGMGSGRPFGRGGM